MMERKLFDGWGLFITKDLSYVGFFTDDRVCLIDIEADGIQIIEKSDFKEDYLLSPTEEAIYGNDNTSDNIEVGDVSVTFHFDDGETFLDSLIVSGSECKKGRIDVEDYLRE